MRDAVRGLEVLLLRRNARAGFVPGAYVFPGGRVDPADASPHALGRLDGVTPAQAADRLGLPEGDPPAIAYYVAALREAFEETGILLGVAPEVVGTGGHDPTGIRDELLADRIGFGEALARLDRRVAADGLEYLAHWITPVSQPRRYDTRFFAARAPQGAEPVVDAREMTEALWVTPSQGIAGARAGALPMILPTVRTLEQLAEFATVAAVLEALPGLAVPRILPGGDAPDGEA